MKPGRALEIRDELPILEDMGLARDLTMGPGRRSTPVRAEFTRLKRMLQRWDADIDTAELRAAILHVGGLPERMRRGEGMIYNDACARYRRLTGEQIGPETATY
jgi:hypothetical protein